MSEEGTPASRPPPRPRSGRWIDALAWVAALVLIGAAGVGAVVLVRLFETIGPDLARFDDRVEVAEAPPPPPTPPPAPVRAPDGTMVTNPAWRTPPRPDYPQSAMKAGRGEVQLVCPVSAEGEIETCEILSETPAGVGFGEAAVASARQASLHPRTVDGVPVAGTIRFTVRFALQ